MQTIRTYRDALYAGVCLMLEEENPCSSSGCPVLQLREFTNSGTVKISKIRGNRICECCDRIFNASPASCPCYVHGRSKAIKKALLWVDSFYSTPTREEIIEKIKTSPLIGNPDYKAKAKN